MKAVVLGASGFIGTRLVRRLAGEGAEVVAIDIVPPRERLPEVQYRSADVRAPLPVELGRGAERIYNLAAVHRTPGHPPREYYETNVWGALNATALAEDCVCPTVVFTSSISVYGPSEAVLSEASPLTPASDYGRSKAMAEAIHRRWRAAGPERKLVVVRPGVVFGPGERGNYTRLAGALRRGLFVYPGRKTAIKSGGYVDELLSTFEFALAAPDPEITYNFAFPAESTTEDIVRTFGEVAGYRARPPVAPIAPMLAAARAFEVADRLGVKNPIHRERVLKLVQSTRVAPGWLMGQGYRFTMDLKGALQRWRDETGGRFD